jgi:hypothetical protein
MFLGLQVVAGVPNSSAIQLDTSDVAKLEDCVSVVNNSLHLSCASLNFFVHQEIEKVQLLWTFCLQKCMICWDVILHFGYVTYGDHGKVLQYFIGSSRGIILMSA